MRSLSMGLIYQILPFGVMAVIIFFAYKNSKKDESLKYRTFWPRFWAPGVDAFVLLPIAFLMQFFSLKIGVTFFIILLTSVLQNVITYTYTIVMHGKFGQTLGKMACKVMVVDHKTEKRITYRQAFLRDCIPILLAGISLAAAYLDSNFREYGQMTPLEMHQINPGGFNNFGFVLAGSISLIWYLAEIITMLTNSKRRALHDFIAGTVVIRTNLESVTAIQNGNPPQNAQE